MSNEIRVIVEDNFGLVVVDVVVFIDAGLEFDWNDLSRVDDGGEWR